MRRGWPGCLAGVQPLPHVWGDGGASVSLGTIWGSSPAVGGRRLLLQAVMAGRVSHAPGPVSREGREGWIGTARLRFFWDGGLYTPYRAGKICGVGGGVLESRLPAARGKPPLLGLLSLVGQQAPWCQIDILRFKVFYEIFRFSYEISP